MEYVKKLEVVEKDLKNRGNPYLFDARELQGLSHPELIQFLVNEIGGLKMELVQVKNQLNDLIIDVRTGEY
jgi:hypothetical protein